MFFKGQIHIQDFYSVGSGLTGHPDPQHLNIDLDDVLQPGQDLVGVQRTEPEPRAPNLEYSVPFVKEVVTNSIY